MIQHLRDSMGYEDSTDSAGLVEPVDPLPVSILLGVERCCGHNYRFAIYKEYCLEMITSWQMHALRRIQLLINVLALPLSTFALVVSIRISMIFS